MITYEIYEYTDPEIINTLRYKVFAKEDGKKLGSMVCPDSEQLLYILHEFKKTYPDGKIEWPKISASHTAMEAVIQAFENGGLTEMPPPQPVCVTIPIEASIP